MSLYCKSQSSKKPKGTRTDRHDATVNYYRDAVRPYLLPFPAKSTPAPSEPEREGTALWEPGDGPAEIDWRALDGVRSVGITAGASAPEVLVNEVIDAFRDRFDVTVEQVETAVERVNFKVPRVLRDIEMEA